jgi:hypothetical protein
MRVMSQEKRGLGQVQDPAHPPVALVDRDVLLAAVRSKQLPPRLPAQLAAPLHPASAADMSTMTLLLGGLLVGEELVLGV